jgi:hypothetical protein
MLPRFASRLASGIRSARPARVSVLGIALLGVSGALLSAQEEARENRENDAPQKAHVLLVKPGSAQATAALARPFLDAFASWLDAHAREALGGPAALDIANSVERADALREAAPPTVVIAPPSYWLHLRAAGVACRPVATIRRFGSAVDRLAILVHEDSPVREPADLAGRVVRVPPGFDENYLQRVVMPGPEPGDGKDDREKGGEEGARTATEATTQLERLGITGFETSRDVADDVFVLAEEPDAPDAPAALLLDDELRRFFAERDPDLWQRLRVVWTSTPLPRELVLAIGPDAQWPQERLDALGAAFCTELGSVREADGGDEVGAKLLRQMNSDGFSPPDRDLLERIRARDALRRKLEAERDGGGGEGSGKNAPTADEAATEEPGGAPRPTRPGRSPGATPDASARPRSRS